MKKILLGFTVLSLLGIGVFFWMQKKEIRTVNPPIPSLDPKFAEYEFDASKGIEFTHQTGSKIKIPANALIDNNQQEIKGLVKIKYREFHSAMEIFASGIPMEYDSANTKNVLQSAGMFQIEAEQNDQKLNLKSDKKITVKLASFKKENDYSAYFWNPETGNWEYKKAPEKAEINQEKIQFLDSLNQLKVTKNKYLLSFGGALDIYFNNNYEKVRNKFMRNQFKKLVNTFQLKSFELPAHTPVVFQGRKYPAYELIWELKNNELKIPKWAQNEIEWDGWNEIQKGEEHTLHYYDEIVFSAKKRIGKGYKISIDKVRKSHEKYIKRDTITQVHKRTKATRKRVKKQTIKTEEKSKIIQHFEFIATPTNRVFRYLRNNPEKYSEAQKAVLAEIEMQEKRMDKVADVFRTMETDGFGIFNYDKLISDKNSVHLVADFQDTKNENPDLVYYISPKHNFVIKYTPNVWDKVSLKKDDPKARIVAVTPSYEVAYFAPEKWQKLNFEQLEKAGNYQFLLENKQQEFTNLKELEEVLEM